MTLTRTMILSALIAVACLAGQTPASAQQAYTPERGTTGRRQILDALRPSPDSPIRFVVRELRVIHGISARYAYAVVHPVGDQNDGGTYLLKDAGGWKVVWQASDGVIRECRKAAEHRLNALYLLEEDGINPELLASDLRASYEDFVNPQGEDPACYETGEEDEDAVVANSDFISPIRASRSRPRGKPSLEFSKLTKW